MSMKMNKIILLATTVFVLLSCTKETLVLSVVVQPNEKTLLVGESVVLSVSLFPQDATNKEFIWSSSDNSIAEVDAEGEVTAISEGEAMIIATATSGVTGTCKVTVISTVGERPKLPIEYVAEYNINATGTGFVTTASNEGSGYFSWSQANDLFSIANLFTVDGIVYYLPSQDEWRGIIPDSAGVTKPILRYTMSTLDLNNPELIRVANKVGNYTADYINTSNKISYGLRFKGEGDQLKSAWRYHYTNNPVGDGNVLIIKVRYLGPTSSTTVGQIANETWWDTPHEDEITRIFQATGFIAAAGQTNTQFFGENGNYWSTTSYEPGARYLRFSPIYASCHNGDLRSYRFAIRLFSMELE